MQCHLINLWFFAWDNVGIHEGEEVQFKFYSTESFLPLGISSRGYKPSTMKANCKLVTGDQNYFRNLSKVDHISILLYVEQQ